MTDTCHENNQMILIKLPLVLRKRGVNWLSNYEEFLFDHRVDGYVASSFDALGYMDAHGIARENVWLNHRLYTWNDFSIHAFSKMGYMHFTAPVELNRKELMHRNNRNSSLIVYGHLPLMVTTNCIHMDIEGCDGQKKLLYLEDRKKKKMPVVNHCPFCYNTYLNYLPTSLLEDMADIEQLNMEAIRVELTVESKADTREILNAAAKAAAGKNISLSRETTRGHFRRGVE